MKDVHRQKGIVTAHIANRACLSPCREVLGRTEALGACRRFFVCVGGPLKRAAYIQGGRRHYADVCTHCLAFPC